jgi:hypothetical protein
MLIEISLKQNAFGLASLNRLTINNHLFKFVAFVYILIFISLTIESSLQTLQIEASPIGSRTHYIYDRLKPWGFTELPQFQANPLVKTSVPQVNLTLQ